MKRCIDDAEDFGLRYSLRARPLGWLKRGSPCLAIKGSFESTPFQPFYWTLAIAESTVSGAFLHGAELWGAFVSLFSLDVPRAYSGWLLGFGSKPRADRLLGWVEVRDLAVQATARAVRTLHDAQRHGGLLASGISQIHYSWEGSRNSYTWFGSILREIRGVRPRFSLISSSP